MLLDLASQLSHLYSLANLNATLDPDQASVSLAKLQNPIKSTFDSINDNLKETHSGLNKFSKALDKVRCPWIPLLYM